MDPTSPDLSTLTRTELALVRFLAAHPNEPQPRERLLVEVFGYRPGVGSRTVDTTVRRIRSKIEPDPRHPRWLRTVPGRGYAWVQPEPTGIVGRLGEVAAVRDWLARGGPLLVVVGPPGIGKSAVVGAAVGDAVPRIDLGRATSGAALAALDGVSGVVWLDDADPVALDVVPHAIRPGRRAIVTCRFPVDQPGARLLQVGPLPDDQLAELLRLWCLNRFPGATPPRLTGGNPLAAWIELWDRLAGRAPPTGYPSLAAAARWSIDALPPGWLDRLGVLAAVPAKLDRRAVELLWGGPDRAALAALRDRWLIVGDDDGFEVPAPVREALGALPVPERLPELVEAFLAALQGNMIGATERERTDARKWLDAHWDALAWSAYHVADLRQIYGVASCLEVVATGTGGRHDTRAVLDHALAQPLPPLWRARLLWRRVAAAERVGDASEGLDALLDESFELTRVGGDRFVEPGGVVLLRRLERRRIRGEFDELVAEAPAVAADADSRDNPYQASEARMELAYALVARGRIDEAVLAARAARASWDGALENASFLSAWAEILLGACELGGARAALDELRLRLLEDGRPVMAARGEMLELRYALLAGAVPDRADAVEAHVADRTLGPESLLPVSVLALLRGDPERAVHHLRAVDAGMRSREVRGPCRMLTAAARAASGLPMVLPPALPGDPELERLTAAFEALASGGPVEPPDVPASEYARHGAVVLRDLLDQRGAQPFVSSRSARQRATCRGP